MTGLLKVSSRRDFVAVEPGTENDRMTEHRPKTWIVSLLLSYNVKIMSHFYWISKSFRNYQKLPKYWIIQSFRTNK